MKGRLEAPKVLTDIYADLRDRRLLIPVIGLIVAIAAVPFLVGGDPAPVPATPAAASLPDDATEVESAVLLDQTGIRNYRTRLDALRKKNPFEQQFEIEPEDTSVEVGEAAAGSTTVGDPSVSLAGSEDTAATDTATAEPATTDPVTSSPSTVTSSPPSAGGDPSISFRGNSDSPPDSGEQRTDVREVETVVSYSIDVEVGRAGKLEARDAVERFEPLPSKRAPVVIYVGVSENAKRAAFLVSRDVTETNGDGFCVRSKSGVCSLLTMKVGDHREFIYGPNGERFRLKLRSIFAVEEPAGK